MMVSLMTWQKASFLLKKKKKSTQLMSQQRNLLFPLWQLVYTQSFWQGIPQIYLCWISRQLVLQLRLFYLLEFQTSLGTMYRISGRPNPPVEHYEGGGCSRGVLVDDDNIHGPISESCGGHLYLPACHSLGNLNSCCHCGEEAVADYVFLPCFHKIHRNCYFIRIQRHMRTCPVCGQVF
ncbi:uncharacterized protein LOC111330736 isoform X5 [Stylophora pistillata]|uniref:uncharacterized protein LOC111330736 isoform X5 n=1 Tax=Stylophora pistillata TaxID=50429 RepID=UPI000C03ABD1|nr:uncharacterized protein LOC111330736 isoform X5 [Stylophora pistillata]